MERLSATGCVNVRSLNVVLVSPLAPGFLTYKPGRPGSEVAFMLRSCMSRQALAPPLPHPGQFCQGVLVCSNYL